MAGGDQHGVGKKQTELDRLPDVLMLHLKRFVFTSNRAQKVEHSVACAVLPDEMLPASPCCLQLLWAVLPANVAYRALKMHSTASTSDQGGLAGFHPRLLWGAFRIRIETLVARVEAEPEHEPERRR